MTELKEGQTAPDFTLPPAGGESLTLSALRGQAVVLYFYPKDDTPGCTKQACGFRDDMQALKSLNAAVIGVSKDSVASHDKFRAKYGLNFPLVSDENGTVCETYGVWTEKNMYGRKYMGIERSTFLIDREGKIARIWHKVKVEDHIAEVVEAVRALAA